ncbi:MAG: carboxynorspermidine decarboxylase, partial [Muribaculaceae bacterium]|nr:carboxynorspermidine decarboxylase [Muribaculaceae bacterium]
MTANDIPTPFFIVYEDRLRSNLELIRSVGKRSGSDIIMAFKANALWRTFPIVRQYCRNCTASSINELMLGAE